MDNTLEFVKSLETKIWDASVSKDKKGFMNFVSPDAVMVCGGYRCLGKEYAQFVSEGIVLSYKFINFEVVYESEEVIQVHYVVDTEAFDDKDADCAGKFHVTSTWQRQDGGFKLIFNMDSKIFE